MQTIIQFDFYWAWNKKHITRKHSRKHFPSNALQFILLPYYYYVTFQNGYLNGSSIFKTYWTQQRACVCIRIRMCVNAVNWKVRWNTYKCKRGNFQCNFSPGCIACNKDNSVITKPNIYFDVFSEPHTTHSWNTLFDFIILKYFRILKSK